MSQTKKETQITIANQNIKQELGKMIAGSFYDHQEVRITEFNRVRDIIRRKLENIPLVGEIEEKKEDKEKFKEKFVDKKIPIYLKQLSDEGKITDEQKHYIERILEVQNNAEKFEKEYEKLMKEFVESEKVYTEFLKKIKGISGILSANLIKEFGYCENAPHISSLWKYCGMHVSDGAAPVRKKGEKLEFNARLRTMVWKVGDSFIKQRTPFYRDIYDKEKERQVNLMENAIGEMSKKEKKDFDKITKKKEKRELMDKFNKKAPVSLMNAHLRANRKMVKIFLAHYWMACKELKPLNARKPQRNSEPYVKSKMGHKHISDWKEAVESQVKKKPDDKVKAKITKKPTKN